VPLLACRAVFTDHRKPPSVGYKLSKFRRSHYARTGTAGQASSGTQFTHPSSLAVPSARRVATDAGQQASAIRGTFWARITKPAHRDAALMCGESCHAQFSQVQGGPSLRAAAPRPARSGSGAIIGFGHESCITVATVPRGSQRAGLAAEANPRACEHAPYVFGERREGNPRACEHAPYAARGVSPRGSDVID
jgi:hypothetical protein